VKPSLVLALVAAVASASGAAHAVDVYKWIDGHGVVHYGDHPASGVQTSRVSVPGGGANPAEREAAAASLDADREKLKRIAARNPASAPSSPPPGPQAVESACAASWRRYDAAQACFDANRVAGGKGVSENGAAACQDIPQPSCPR
jgi:hypothetical protein